MDRVAKRVLDDISNAVCNCDDYTEAMRLWREYQEHGGCTDEEADIAFSIAADKTQTEIVQALLLSGCPDNVLEEAFAVPARSVAIYNELFFNTKVFRTSLDKLSYVENYPDSFGRELKIRALNLGYEYVLYTYGNIVPKTEAQRALVQRMFMSSAYKAMSMNYNGITSSVTKQAVEHAKLMLKAFEALERTSAETVHAEYDLSRILMTEEKPDTRPGPAVEII